MLAFFLKFLSSGFFSHIFAIASQLPCFSISILRNVEDSFNVNIFFNCKYKCEYKRLFIQIYLCGMLHKTSFLLPQLFSQQFQTFQFLKQKYCLCFKITLKLHSSDIDLLNVHLNLLDTLIPSKHFVCLPDVLLTSSRHVFKKCLQGILMASSAQQFFVSQHVLNMSSRHLQDVLRDILKTLLRDVFITSWKTKNCYAEDVLKASSRCLEDEQMFLGFNINQPLLTCSNSSQHLQTNFQ